MSEDFAFDEIAEDIRTQDGAMTSHPYFVVFDGNPYWLFVHAFFTRAAAERYIEGRSHNLRRPFIWVASAHDNYEVRAARAAFAEIARLRSIVAKWEALHADNVGALSDAGVRRNENDEISSGIEALDQDRDDLLAEWGVVLDFVFPHREPEDQYNGRDVVDAIQEMIEEAR